MSGVESRRARPHTMADCLTCGQDAGHLPDSPATQQRWARRHAEQHPGHVVHATTENIRVYETSTR